MTQLKLLLLEDDKPTAEILKERLEELDIEVETELDPTKWKTKAADTECDFVVTDLMDNERMGQHPGNEVAEHVLNCHFVPLIIHSGMANLNDQFSDDYTKHPLIHIVSKTEVEDSVLVVKQRVDEFKRLATELRRVRSEVETTVHQTLSKTVLAFRESTDGQWHEVISHLVRRRIAAVFDEPCGDSDSIHAVERYLIPPVAASLLTGDILRGKDESGQWTGELRLVLTQSCDLAWKAKTATEKGRKPKVASVLAARLADEETILGRLPELRKIPSEEPARVEEMRKLIENLANGNLSAGLLLLPQVPGVPKNPLVFNLKDLELIKLVDIAGGHEESPATAPWARVASQDSPFREQVTWSMTSIQGRPALPDMNQKSVQEALYERLKEHKNGQLGRTPKA